MRANVGPIFAGIAPALIPSACANLMHFAHLQRCQLERTVFAECHEQIRQAPEAGEFGIRCRELRDCVESAAGSTVLHSYDAWPVYEQLVPWSSDEVPLHTPISFYTPISEMRANGAKIGPEGEKMFALIYDIRRQCLADLAQSIKDE